MSRVLKELLTTTNYAQVENKMNEHVPLLARTVPFACNDPLENQSFKHFRLL